MPIPQDRVIAIINAGMDYEQALKRLMEFINMEVKDVYLGKQSSSEALDKIAAMDQLFLLLKKPLESPATLKIEYAYFKRNYSRNIAASKWQAKTREKKRLGIPTRAKKPNARFANLTTLGEEIEVNERTQQAIAEANMPDGEEEFQVEGTMDGADLTSDKEMAKLEKIAEKETRRKEELAQAIAVKPKLDRKD